MSYLAKEGKWIGCVVLFEGFDLCLRRSIAPIEQIRAAKLNIPSAFTWPARGGARSWSCDHGTLRMFT